MNANKLIDNATEITEQKDEMLTLPQLEQYVLQMAEDANRISTVSAVFGQAVEQIEEIAVQTHNRVMAILYPEQ